MNRFLADPTPWLELDLPLPPPDNHCHRSGMGRRYATAAYRDWLLQAGEILRGTLGEWEPDSERWWCVEIELYLPVRPGDGQNRIKPILDMLSGHTPDPGQTNAKGEPIGPIVKRGGLWDDDSRIYDLSLCVLEVNTAEPRVRIFAELSTCPPLDRRAVDLADEKARKKALREEARAARSAEKAAAKSRRETPSAR